MNSDQTERSKRALDEQKGLIRAIAGNIVAASDAGTAIRILTEELEELKSTTGNEVASEEFMRAVSGHGTMCSVLCEHCGRTHFVGEGHGDYDDGELEDLRSNAQKHPGKYIEHNDYDTIDWGYLDGKQTVWGCPCNSARRYERWIWGHRYVIARYLKLKAEQLALEAKFATELAEQAAEIETV